jgi:uncharacterized protein YkwD
MRHRLTPSSEALSAEKPRCPIVTRDFMILKTRRPALCVARIGTVSLAALIAGVVGLTPATASTTGTAKSKNAVHHVVKKKKRAVRPPAPAVLSSYEGRLLVLTNQARVADGLHALVAAPGATDVARRWSAVLATQDGLAHNPSVANDLAQAGSPGWTVVTENVGMGPAGDADTLFTAYMNSPHHRENILDPAVRYVGIGAVSVNTPDNGPMTFDTMDFTDSYSMTYGAGRTHVLDTVVAAVAQLPSLLRFGP